MSPKTILRILAAMLIPIFILIGIKVQTNLPNEKNNGFSRRWASSETNLLLQTSLPFTQPKITGITDSLLYLADNDPRIILGLNKTFTKIDTIIINVDIPEDKLSPYTINFINSRIYVHLNNLKGILFGDFPESNLKAIEIKSGIFTKSSQLSDSFLVVRSLNKSFQGQSFKKINTYSGEIIKEKDFFLNQKDAGISTDGLILTDSSNIYYIEYFRNNIYCMDKDLNLVYHSNTIDTISTTQASLNSILGEKGNTAKIVPSSARIVVNKSGFLYGNYILLISGLRADNENLSSFNKNTTLDIYNKKNGKYWGSISVPKINGKPFLSARISNDSLFTTYSKLLAVYQIPKLP